MRVLNFESSLQRKYITDNLISLIQYMLELKYSNNPNKYNLGYLIIKHQVFFDYGIDDAKQYRSFYMKKLDLDKIYKMSTDYAAVDSSMTVKDFPDKCEWSKENLADIDFIENFIDKYSR